MTKDEELLEKSLYEKFSREKCPRCGKKMLVLKDKYKKYITPVDKKYRGICHSCLTEEEIEEIRYYQHRASMKNKLRVVK